MFDNLWDKLCCCCYWFIQKIQIPSSAEAKNSIAIANARILIRNSKNLFHKDFGLRLKLYPAYVYFLDKFITTEQQHPPNLHSKYSNFLKIIKFLFVWIVIFVQFLNESCRMPSVENVEEGAAPQVPKTELEELQIKANSVADEVRKNTISNCNNSEHLLLTQLSKSQGQYPSISGQLPSNWSNHIETKWTWNHYKLL